MLPHDAEPKLPKIAATSAADLKHSLTENEEMQLPTNDPAAIVRFANALSGRDASAREELDEFQLANLAHLRLAVIPEPRESDPHLLRRLKLQSLELLSNIMNNWTTWASIVLGRKIESEQDLSDED